MNTIKNLSTGKIFLAPSLLSADFANLQSQIMKVEQEGVSLLHIDIMDGHFVPNLTMGPSVVKCIRNVTNLIFDVHLMLTDPIDFIKPFAKCGSNHITFHIECDNDINGVIKLIRKHSMSVGLSIRPNTAIEEIYPYLNYIDLILIMTVEPGFGGQFFVPDMIQKIKTIRKKLNSFKKQLHVQIDGGINTDTITAAVNAGANIMVAGNSIFGTEDGIKGKISLLRSHILGKGLKSDIF